MIIPVFAINLKSRTDRRRHFLQQFCQKEEFDVHIVGAFKHRNGAMGLWKSLVHILQSLVNAESDYVIICEDDHEFTSEYNKEYLFECIAEAKERDADILSGGVSWFQTAIRSSGNIFWIENFTGLQFTVIFKKFYHTIDSGLSLINNHLTQERRNLYPQSGAICQPPIIELVPRYKEVATIKAACDELNISSDFSEFAKCGLFPGFKGMRKAQ